MSAPTARKTPAKKAAPKRSPRAAKPPAETPPVPTDAELAAEAAALMENGHTPPDENGIRPVVVGKRGRKGSAIPLVMVTVFELDDVKYQVPKEPSPALVLRYLNDLVKYGLNGAVARMAFTLLGEGPMEVLAASSEVSAEDVGDVFANVGVIFYGSDTYKRIMASSDPS